MCLLTAKKKFIRNLTLLTIGITVLSVLIFQLLIPERYFVCFPFIPLFFYLYGLFYIHVSLFVYRHNVDKLIAVSLVLRALKFFLTLIAVVICGFVARQHVIAFGLTFMAYYLAYLIFEASLSFAVEMKHKNKK